MEQYLIDILEKCKNNLIISDAFTKADSVINNPKYKSIVCAISGGADSDIVLDLVSKVDRDKKVKYVWFDTGIEYQATKDHLHYLENKYEVDIIRYKAKKPIPLAVKEYGQPFLSKYVSEMLSRLQRHNFQWEDLSYEELIKKYPNCSGALHWWTNTNGKETDKFDISRFKYLKEFIIQNPPTFKISAQCCDWAKKKVAHSLNKEFNTDLSIIGVRKAEGGIRAVAYKSCFDNNADIDRYRPIFWYLDTDKVQHEHLFNITHSDCYKKYGLDRTGCVGCPFGKYFENELKAVSRYEPKLYVAVNNIFKDSYEYTRRYLDFKKSQTMKNKGYHKLF